MYEPCQIPKPKGVGLVTNWRIALIVTIGCLTTAHTRRIYHPVPVSKNLRSGLDFYALYILRWQRPPANNRIYTILKVLYETVGSVRGTECLCTRVFYHVYRIKTMAGTPWVRLQVGQNNEQEGGCLAHAKASASRSYPQSDSPDLSTDRLYPKANAIGVHGASL